MKNCKFLIAGDVKGNFSKLFKRVASVNKKKGPFDFLLCVGSFFGDKNQDFEHYIKNCFDIPLTVYILGPNNEEERQFYPDELNTLSDINSKVIYLGKRGTFTTCEGLRIGFLSGLESKSKTSKDCAFNENDVSTLMPKGGIADSPVVDVFITSVWPANVSDLHNTDIQPRNASKLLSSVVTDLQPWYHFAGFENTFYERAPYSNKNSEGELSSVTRFIALASVSSDEKWLHAISMTIPKEFTRSELENLAGVMTLCPFPQSNSGSMHSFRYDFSTKNTDKKRRKGGNDRNKKMKIDAEKDCWFCLSSGKAENHLIIAIGKHAYLSLNRGGLVSQHLNIFPIEHIASMSQASQAVLNDVETFKSLLKKYFKKSGFQIIFFERYYKTFHSQIHCIPLLPEMSDRVEKIFTEKIQELESVHFELMDSDMLEDLPPDQNYFHVSFPNGGGLLAKIDARFPLNFGRDVLVDKSLMNSEEKADWRNCVLTVEEETEIVSDLRKYIVYE